MFLSLGEYDNPLQSENPGFTALGRVVGSGWCKQMSTSLAFRVISSVLFVSVSTSYICWVHCSLLQRGLKWESQWVGVWDQEGSILHKLPEGKLTQHLSPLCPIQVLATRLNSFTTDIRMASREPTDKARPSHRRVETHSLQPDEVSICFLWKCKWKQEMPLSPSMERMAYQAKKINQSYRLMGSSAEVMQLQLGLMPGLSKWLLLPQLRHSGRNAKDALDEYLTSTCFSKLGPEWSLRSDSCRIAGIGTIWNRMSQTLVFSGDAKLIFSTKDFHWCQLHFWKLSRKIWIFGIQFPGAYVNISKISHLLIHY